MQADFFVDVTYAHCGELLGLNLSALPPALDSGRLRLVLRVKLRADLAARDLARHLLAAADPAQCRLLGALLIGTPEGRSWAVMRGRWSEIIDPTPIEQRLEAFRGVIDEALSADQAIAESHRLTQMPTLILRDRAGETGRWSGTRFTVPEIVDAVERVPAP